MKHFPFIPAAAAIILFPWKTWTQIESLRWPVSPSISRVNYGMDNDAAADKMADYQCGVKTYEGHRGTDIGAPRNSEVFAADSGWVQARADGFGDGYLGSQDGNGFGNHVVLFHDPDHNTIYGHFTAGTGIPSKGDTVACGARLGASGTSGNSSGPHMHFELRLKVNKSNYYSGSEVDPFSGPCSTPVNYWRQLNASGVPLTACAAPVIAIKGYAQSGPSSGKTLIFAGSPTIDFVVPAGEKKTGSRVSLDLYDARGKRLSHLIDEWMPAGPQQRMLRGFPAGRGVYFGRFAWEDIPGETVILVKTR